MKKQELQKVLNDVRNGELRHNLLPLRIQLFAEDGGENGGDKTYTQAEMDAIIQERDKLKNRTDELSKSEKALKEQLKQKLSAEEKEKQDKEEKDNELQKELAKLKADNLTYKVKSELVAGGYNEKEIETITKHILANDIDNLVKELSTQRKALKEELTKSITAELQKQNKLPGGQGGNNDDNNPEFLQRMIDSKKGQGDKKGGYYLGNKN